jgi:hypothetical protein
MLLFDAAVLRSHLVAAGIAGQESQAAGLDLLRKDRILPRIKVSAEINTRRAKLLAVPTR